VALQDGWSPLHLAASNGHLGVVWQLLHERAAVDARTKVRKAGLRIVDVASVLGPKARFGTGNRAFCCQQGANRDMVMPPRFLGIKYLQIGEDRGVAAAGQAAQHWLGDLGVCHLVIGLQ
jgi:hypothetical protein